MNRLRDWARRLKREVLALWFCQRHPRTPLLAKGLALFVVAYAFSPIDLIPDFIPVLGYLDEVILLPGLIWLLLRLVPEAVMAECRAQADAWLAERRERPRSYAFAAAVVVLWLILAWLCVRLILD